MKMPSLLRSTFSVSSMTMLSRVLGLAREVVIATVFGVSAMTDAFWVAFRIPNFLRRLFAEGSFSLAFVPVFTEVRESGDQEKLRELVARSAGTLGAVVLVVSALGMLAAPWLTRVFAPGYLDDPLRLALTSDLLRITFPFLFFVSLTALSAGALNAMHRFALPSVTPVILNLCMIGAALWLSPRLEVPIMALGWAVLLAGFLQLLVQLPALRRLGLLSWPRWGWRHPKVHKILKLMVPTLFGSSVAQINLLFDTLLASFLITGSQTWLAQSDRLLEFPLGVFGVALGTVILPALSRHHVTTDAAGFRSALDWALRMALLIAIPAAIGLVLLAGPMIATLFQHGAYTAHDTRMASLSLAALGLGLPAFALIKVLAPAFYARQDTRTPVKAGILAMLANMLLCVAFLGLLLFFWAPSAAGDLRQQLAAIPGLHVALALASATAGYLNAGYLWLALRKRGDFQPAPGWTRHGLRLLLGAAVLVLVLLAGRWMLPAFAVIEPAARVLRLAILVLAGGAGFLGSLWLLGMRPGDFRAK